MSDLTIVDVPERHFVMLRSQTRPDIVPKTIDELDARLIAAGVHQVMAGGPVAFYFSWEEGGCEMGWAAPVESGVTLPETESYVQPAGRAFFLEHRGPYRMIPEAWNRMWSLVGSHGLETESPCWEDYRNDPQNTAEEDLITHLLIPIKG